MCVRGGLQGGYYMYAWLLGEGGIPKAYMCVQGGGGPKTRVNLRTYFI